MNPLRRRIALALSPPGLLTLGTLLSAASARLARAGGGVRSGESSSISGAFAIQQSPDMKQQVPLEAIYWIDYRAAKLFATTPEVSRSAATSGVIGEIAVRDLVDDFKLGAGAAPHFLMNTASLGALGGGTSVLVVVETTTRQAAIYWTYARSSGLNAKPEFDLVQVKPYGAIAGPEGGAPLASISTSGPVIVQTSMDRKQVPLDAVYWLEFNEEGSRLFAVIPEVRKTAAKTQMVGEVAVRSIAADFKLRPGEAPNFLMSTASLGVVQMGMSALFVIETNTNQVGVYRSFPKATAGGAKPEIELLKVKTYETPLPELPAAQ